MERTMIYDLQAMKTAAKESRNLLQEIRRDLWKISRDNGEWDLNIRKLERVCRGYDLLINDLDAAVNIYGAAEAAAAETAAF